MILRKGRSPLFDCFQKQAHKTRDLDNGIVFKRLTDDIRTYEHIARCVGGRQERERNKDWIYNKTDTLIK